MLFPLPVPPIVPVLVTVVEEGLLCRGVRLYQVRTCLTRPFQRVLGLCHVLIKARARRFLVKRMGVGVVDIGLPRVARAGLGHSLRLKERDTRRLINEGIGTARQRLRYLFHVGVRQGRRLGKEERGLRAFLSARKSLLPRNVQCVFRLRQLHVNGDGHVRRTLQHVRRCKVKARCHVQGVVLASNARHTTRLRQRRFKNSHQVSMLRYVQLRKGRTNENVRLIRRFLFGLQKVCPCLVVRTLVVNVVRGGKVGTLSRRVIRRCHSLVLCLSARF